MKKALCLILILAVVCSSVSALDFNSAAELSASLEQYSKDVVQGIPTQTSVDNLYADAWIGNLLSLPPHLSVGINAGAAFVGSKESQLLNGIGSAFGVQNMPSMPGTPVPAISVNARIGGIILPFDVGFHGMVGDANMNDFGTDAFTGTAKVNTYGADFRYCLIKQKLIIPAVSLGIGYDHVEFATKLSAQASGVTVPFEFTVNSDIVTATAQASWNLLIIKIFGGARAALPLGDGITSSYKVGSDPLKTTANTGLHCSVFAGAALRLLILDTTLGVSYDLTSNIYGGSLSLRLQL